MTTTTARDATTRTATVPPQRDVVLHVEGVVEHGDQRGRLLGFPTANIGVPEHGLRDGVWAGTVQLDPEHDGPVHVAAVSVGHRPTYYGKDGDRLLEAHLLDFAGDLYDRRVLVRLHVRLRPQRRFSGSGELVEQMQRDVADTRAWAAASLPRNEPETRAATTGNTPSAQ
ncbi:riboflavin kinase [Kineococcus rhizosphaerae]|uniref:riboflavin kinase n=1 Tax=Kineococcus rhizosphaerae TaxID=559628 RepID=A0A2T0QXN7_9ACTN|nr:riboflavin kinase [Kineococcus rhizosphaerae]PRY10797.1 riboflavin kinase/FMN adenylyltransferase [Kineococcus rhizosphaerae]